MTRETATKPFTIPAWLAILLALLGPSLAVASGIIAYAQIDGADRAALSDLERRLTAAEIDAKATREAVIDMRADIRWMRSQMERHPREQP